MARSEGRSQGKQEKWPIEQAGSEDKCRVQEMGKFIGSGVNIKLKQWHFR